MGKMLTRRCASRPNENGRPVGARLGGCLYLGELGLVGTRDHRTHGGRLGRVSLVVVEQPAGLVEWRRIRGSAEHHRDEVTAALADPRSHAVAGARDEAGLAAQDVELAVTGETVR